MALLPAKNLLDGSKAPPTSVSEMKSAMGLIRDFLSDLLGTDSSNKSAARTALGATSTGGALFTAADATAARSAINGAKSGANSDITSLSGLTSAIVVSQGGTGATTPSGAAAALGTIGSGQSYSVVTGSRAMDTTYTNSTGRTIVVQGYANNSSGGIIATVINGISTSNFIAASGAPAMPFMMVVPPGTTYRVSVTAGSVSLAQWVELS